MSNSVHASPVGSGEILGGAEFPIRRYVKAIVASVSGWATARANDLAAAAIYEELSRLSDAELHRLGLSRATLARDIGLTFGRS
jgi:hypothetical protein